MLAANTSGGLCPAPTHQHIHTSPGSCCPSEGFIPGSFPLACGTMSPVWYLRCAGPGGSPWEEELAGMEPSNPLGCVPTGEGWGGLRWLHWPRQWPVSQPGWWHQTHLHAQVKSSEEEKAEEIPSSPVQQAPFGAHGMQGSVAVGHLCTLTLGLPGVKGHQKWSHLALFFPSSSCPCKTKH